MSSLSLSFSLSVFSFAVSDSNNNFKYILKLLNALTSPALRLAQQNRPLPLEWREVDGPSWRRRGCLRSAHVGGSRLCVAVGGNERGGKKIEREEHMERETKTRDKIVKLSFYKY